MVSLNNIFWNTLLLDQVWSILPALVLLSVGCSSSRLEGEQLQCRQNGSNLIYNVTYLYSIDCTQNQIPKSCPTHKRKNLDFILVGSDAKTQTRFNTSITLWPITFHHLTQRKKCDSITSSSRRIYLVLLSTIRKHPKMPNTAVLIKRPRKSFSSFHPFGWFHAVKFGNWM